MYKSSIGPLIEKHKALFETVNDREIKINAQHDVEYSILNYKKILSDMCEYVQGYFDYKKQGEDKYAGKLLDSTHKFYDEMFNDVRYRTTISLYDMKRINQEFIAGTKQLQDKIDIDTDLLSEEQAVIIMTDNQYKKLMKVYKDDVAIYCWLTSKESKVFNTGINEDLRRAFLDKSTPVIHQLKGKK